MSKQPHICVDENQVAPYIIVCGEPDRVNRKTQQRLVRSSFQSLASFGRLCLMIYYAMHKNQLEMPLKLGKENEHYNDS